MNKVVFKLSLIIMITCLLIVGCSSNKMPKLDKKNPVTVTIWHYYIGEQKKAFDRLVSEFNNSYGMDYGIIVEAFSKSDINSLVSEINASINHEPNSEPAPDAFFTYSDSVYTMAKDGLIAAFDDYLTDKELDTYIFGFLDEGRFLPDRKLYILPLVKSTEVIMMNATAWEEFINENPSFSIEDLSTWEGISTVGEAYYNWTDSKTDFINDGKTFFGIDSVSNFIISTSKQMGVDLMENTDSGGIVNIDETVFRKIWETYYINVVKGYFGSYGRFRSDDVKTGDIISYLGSTSSGAYFPTTISDDEGQDTNVSCAVYMMPVYEGKDKIAIQQGAGVALLKSEVKKEYATATFFQWLNNETERNIDFALEASYLPVTAEAIESIVNNSDIIDNKNISKNVSSVLNVAGKQVLSYQMYLTKPFETSYNIRVALETTLKNYSENARKAFLKKLDLGIPYDEAIEDYISESNFQEFYKKMKKSVEKLLTQ